MANYVYKRFLHSSVRRLGSDTKFQWIRPTGTDTNLLVYNPVKKCKTPLILRHPNVATWYMCGPTVYDSAHIGHACTYMKFDIIRRVMTEFFDINVVVCMGMTDIDDKIIKRAIDTGESWQSITQRYENEFFSDMDSLNISRPMLYCKVSAYIPQIVDFIKKIADKGVAYIGKDGSMYFDTSKHSSYGKLEVPQIEETHQNKRSSLDFALWKKSKENEPHWESPWGRGRPGWHIECSAIASAIFGNNIDIHSGGIDLAFPHHENEEAQSCCHHNVEQWVNYWLHTGHLHLEGDTKMSKSLQNTVSIANMLKSCTPNQFRMFCLLSHYRNNVIYSSQLVNTASELLKKIEFFISNCNDYVAGNYCGGNVDSITLLKNLEQTRKKVYEALADDYNTPNAIQAIIKFISSTNKMMADEKKTNGIRDPGSVAAASNYVQTFISKLGIKLSSERQSRRDLSNILDILINFRHDVRLQAKKDKNMELLQSCDTVRTSLSNCGIDVRDRAHQSTWTVRSK
ncbi:hypothetical protein TKK_0009369 [Trichogramma kaykai]|uniref:cysteine--tRNA ligase n=1 Tax=Trichogramma kaykai TaxID=54128 RepID=A0ABD2WYY6_9HYME